MVNVLRFGRPMTMFVTLFRGKYYGIVKPSSDSYIQTTNGVNLDVIWQKNSNDIIVNLEDDSISIIHNTSPKSTGIINYNSLKKYNDSLFTNFDGKYHRYKKNIDYISIFINEDYATDKNGKKL